MSMKPGFAPRAERIVDLTEEFIKTLPIGNSGCDHWYDKTDRRLMVTRLPGGNNDPIFRYNTSAKERRALNLKSSTCYLVIGRIPLAEARTKAAELRAHIDKVMETYVDPLRKVRSDKRRTSKALSYDAVPEAYDLMADRSEEGSARYEVLMSILMDAYAQAANGKGHARHSGGGKVPFTKQDMIAIIDATSMDFGIGQAIKKLLEGRRMEDKAAMRAEFLGAIVYVAGVILTIDKEQDTKEEKC